MFPPKKRKECEKMVQAKNGDTVKVHYTGKLEDGKIFKSSADGDPLQFTIGESKIISGFEQAIVGMSPGESKTEKVPAHQAFGPYKEESVLEVDRKLDSTRNKTRNR